MSPVAHEARYFRARNMAYRAWANSQPQYVIPGVLEQADGTCPLSESIGLFERSEGRGLEEVDATRADGDYGCGVHLLEPAGPLLDPPQGGGLDLNDTAPGRTTPQVKRGRGQKEDSLP